jgi:hypothetical protein
MALGSASAPFFGAAGAAAGGGGSEIKKSLRFNAADSAYLSRFPANEGDLNTWTLSFWVKKSKLDVNEILFGYLDAGATNGQFLRYLSGNTLDFAQIQSGSYTARLITDQGFRDPSAWAHMVVVWDSSNGTADSRHRIYINGVEVDQFSTRTNPSPSLNSLINTTVEHGIGTYGTFRGVYLSAYLADINFIDGQALAPTDFGEFDPTTGVWNPLSDLSGLTYGTNGYRLTFSNTGSIESLGYDSSGQGNNFDAVNFTPLGVTAANTDTISTVTIESQAVSTFKNRRGGGSNAGAPNNSWASAINMGDQVINVGSTFNPSDPSVINWGSDAWLYFELDTASAVTIGYPSLISAQAAVLYGSNNGGATWNFIAYETNRGRRITSTTAYQYYAYANPGQNVAANDWTILPAKTVLTLASDQDLSKIYPSDAVSQDSGTTLSSDTISGFTRLDYQNDATFTGNLNTIANAFRPEYNSVPPWSPGLSTASADFTSLGLYVTSIGVWATMSNNSSGWNVDGSRLNVNGVNVSSTATAVLKPISGWAGSAWLVTHTFSTPTLLGLVDAYAANANQYVSGYYIDGVKAVRGDTKLDLTGSTNLSSFAAGDTIYQDNASAGPTYSSNLTGTSGGSSATVTNPTSLYNGSTSGYATLFGSNTTNIITHNTSISNVQRLEVYLEVGNTSSEVSVNGSGWVTNTGAGWNDVTALLPFSGNLTSIQVREFYGGSSNFPRWHAIRVNGQILKDADLIPNGTVLGSAPSANQLLLSGTGGSWDTSSTQTAEVTKAAGTGNVFEVDSTTNTIKLTEVANTWLGGVGKYVVGPNTYVSNGNTDTLTDHPTSGASSGDTGLGGQISGNYCTLNPLANNQTTISNGNLTLVGSASVASGALSTFFVSSGKWYWEATFSNVVGSDWGALGVGRTVGIPGQSSASYIYRNNGLKMNNNITSSYGDTWVSGDVIGVALDLQNLSITFYRNGSSQGVAFSGMSAGLYSPEVGELGGGAYSTANLNFGQRPFAHAAPEGFKALCTANLVEPLIKNSSTAMDVVTYSGTGSAQTITLPGTGFDPSLLWIKRRNLPLADHVLYDALRGFGTSATKTLYPNQALSEDTTSVITSTTSTGFNLSGSGLETNQSGGTYVGWIWNVGSSNTTYTPGVTPGAGTVASTVRANVSAGCSVVTYDGGSTGNVTVAHGLGAKPALIIVKNRDSALSWMVYHESLTATSYLILQRNNIANQSIDRWNNTEPTPDVFTVGTNGQVIGNCLALCFAPVDGFSAFGSYVGTGSSDGPFLSTGFRPRWLLFKASTDTTDWIILDAQRNPYNVVGDYLRPNTQDEDANAAFGDFVSNGFKIRNAFQSSNFANTTYVWAAFAENPFKYTRAR